MCVRVIAKHVLNEQVAKDVLLRAFLRRFFGVLLVCAKFPAIKLWPFLFLKIVQNVLQYCTYSASVYC